MLGHVGGVPVEEAVLLALGGGASSAWLLARHWISSHLPSGRGSLPRTTPATTSRSRSPG